MSAAVWHLWWCMWLLPSFLSAMWLFFWGHLLLGRLASLVRCFDWMDRQTVYLRPSWLWWWDPSTRSWLICLQQCGICDDACGYCLLSYQRCGFSPSFNGLVLSDIVGLWSHQGLSAIHHYPQKPVVQGGLESLLNSELAMWPISSRFPPLRICD